MGTLARAGAIAAIVASALAPAAPSAKACECGARPEINQEYVGRAAAVFKGRVVAVVLERQVVHGGQVITSGRRMLFEVTEYWKGSIPASGFVWVETPWGCGIWFDVGEAYVVFAFASARGLATDVCERTTPLKPWGAKDVLSALGPATRVEGARDWLTPPLGN